jgi:hypothetical protein
MEKPECKFCGQSGYEFGRTVICPTCASASKLEGRTVRNRRREIWVIHSAKLGPGKAIVTSMPIYEATPGWFVTWNDIRAMIAGKLS